MVKLKVASRFLYAVDRKIYDAGEDIIVSDQAEADYFIKHKLATAVKPEAKKEVAEPIKEVKPQTKAKK